MIEIDMKKVSSTVSWCCDEIDIASDIKECTLRGIDYKALTSRYYFDPSGWNLKYMLGLNVIKCFDEKSQHLQNIKPRPLMVKGKMILPQKAIRFSEDDLKLLAEYKDKKVDKKFRVVIEISKKKHSMYFV